MKKIQTIPFETRRALSKLGGLLRGKKHGRYLMKVYHSTPKRIRLDQTLGRHENYEHLWWSK